ncbi:MAG: hypothetical protein HOG49_38645 [Candidatus Scalindua sp.]|jgi:heparosan-N-sulfate-glucuronate 5-epimerase|nr:hypothetical protein [Candidatus Scalindua sp.]
MSLKFHFKLSDENRIKINNNYDSYYIHCNKLWNIDITGKSPFISFKDGIPYFMYPNIGAKINPAYVAWWGIINLNSYLADNNNHNLEQLNKSVNWLKTNYKEKRDYVYWEYRFDWPNGRTVLKAPWICGLAQALSASLFYRAHKLNKESSLTNLAEKALNIFNYSIEDGGLKTTLNGYDFYEEYPTEPSTYVLDGSLFIALAFYDLYLETGNDSLFNSSCEGITNNIDYWNYKNQWSYYGNFGYLSSIQYHMLNTALLEVLFNLTNNMQIRKTIDKWKMFHNSVLKKLFIFIAYYYSNGKYTLLNRQELIRFIKRKMVS